MSKRVSRRELVAGAAATGGALLDGSEARGVIVACSPMLAGRIDYEPALPAPRDGLTQHVPQSSAIKYEAVYPSPFWRAAGLSGYSNSDRQPVHWAGTETSEVFNDDMDGAVRSGERVAEAVSGRL